MSIMAKCCSCLETINECIISDYISTGWCTMSVDSVFQTIRKIDLCWRWVVRQIKIIKCKKKNVRCRMLKQLFYSFIFTDALVCGNFKQIARFAHAQWSIDFINAQPIFGTIYGWQCIFTSGNSWTKKTIEQEDDVTNTQTRQLININHNNSNKSVNSLPNYQCVM